MLIKGKWAIIISSCLVIMTIAIFFIGVFFGDTSKSTVQNGVMDLTDQSLEKNVKVNGQWEFYADQLLTPTEIKTLDTTSSYIQVPGSWQGIVNSDQEVEVGTYRVVVKVQEDNIYGIRVHSIRHANKVFINGVQVGGVGNPTTDLSKYSALEKKFNAYGQSQNGEVEIVIQVAHRFKANGGIVKPIIFGQAINISNYTSRSIIFDSIIITAHLLMGLIILLINMIRNRFTGDLYFGLYCIAQGFYVATQNEKVILVYLQNIDHNTLLNWQFGTLYLTVLFLILFFYQLSKDSLNKYVMRFITLTLCTFGILQSIDNPLVVWLFYNLPPVALQLLPIIVISSGLIYTIYLMIHVIFRVKKEAVSLIVTVIAYMCYMASLGLELLFEVHMGYWPIIVQVTIMVSIAYFISYQNEKANKRVQELTQQLYVQNELKDELIVRISQETNKPLQNLFQASKVLLDGTIGPLKAKQHEAVISINASVNQLKRTVEDFINALKSNGQTQFNIQPASCNNLNEIIYEVSFFIKNPEKVRMIGNIPFELPTVLIDEKRLKQALFNVLHNAVKYTEEGQIVVNAFTKGKYVHITIEDTGIGIESHQLQSIFNTFYQVPNVPQNKNEGLGVGLSISRQYIRMMNGDITVRSQVGKGTIVTIILPIYKEYLGHQEAIETTAATTDVMLKDVFDTEIPLTIKGSRKETILIIDQDKNDLLKMAKQLAKKGYNIYAYNDRENVFDLILNERIDLVVLDAYMTREFVLTLTAEVRKHYQITELPIILLSNTNRLDDVETLFNNGINVIVRKPINREDFMSHIQSLLTMKEAVESSVKQELSYYYAQITPHFLYNTLNSIIGLSFTDAEKSREALEYLAIYFRAKLDFHKQQSMVSIEEEMELVNAYLAIEQLRFRHLQIELEIDESIDIIIPSMTLQPLVENAIHHGLANKKNDSRLFISIQKVDEFVEIVIEDNGSGMSNDQQEQLLKGQSQRLGFLNPFNKIRLMKNSDFKLYSQEGEGTRIVIKLKDSSRR